MPTFEELQADNERLRAELAGRAEQPKPVEPPDEEQDTELVALRQDLPLSKGAERGSMDNPNALFSWWARGAIEALKSLVRALRSGLKPGEGWLNILAESIDECGHELERAGAEYRRKPTRRERNAGGRERSGPGAG